MNTLSQRVVYYRKVGHFDVHATLAAKNLLVMHIYLDARLAAEIYFSKKDYNLTVFEEVMHVRAILKVIHSVWGELHMWIKT